MRRKNPSLSTPRACETRKESSRKAARNRRSLEAQIFQEMLCLLPIDRNNRNVSPIPQLDAYLIIQPGGQIEPGSSICVKNLNTSPLSQLIPKRLAMLPEIHIDKISVVRLTVAYIKLRLIISLHHKLLPKQLVDLEDTGDKDPTDFPFYPSINNASLDTPSINIRLSQLIGNDLLQLLDSFFIMLSANGTILYLSDNVERYIGLSKMCLLGQSFYELVHDCDYKSLLSGLHYPESSQTPSHTTGSLTPSNDSSSSENKVEGRCLISRSPSSSSSSNDRSEHEDSNTHVEAQNQDDNNRVGNSVKTLNKPLNPNLSSFPVDLEVRLKCVPSCSTTLSTTNDDEAMSAAQESIIGISNKTFPSVGKGILNPGYVLETPSTRKINRQTVIKDLFNPEMSNKKKTSPHISPLSYLETIKNSNKPTNAGDRINDTINLINSQTQHTYVHQTRLNRPLTNQHNFKVMHLYGQTICKTINHTQTINSVNVNKTSLSTPNPKKELSNIFVQVPGLDVVCTLLVATPVIGTPVKMALDHHFNRFSDKTFPENKSFPNLRAETMNKPEPFNNYINNSIAFVISKHKLDMKIIYFDERVADLLGYQIWHLIGRSYYEFIHVLDLERFRKNLENLRESGQSQTGIYRLLARKGGYVWISTQAMVYVPGDDVDNTSSPSFDVSTINGCRENWESAGVLRDAIGNAKSNLGSQGGRGRTGGSMLTADDPMFSKALNFTTANKANPSRLNDLKSFTSDCSITNNRAKVSIPNPRPLQTKSDNSSSNYNMFYNKNLPYCTRGQESTQIICRHNIVSCCERGEDVLTQSQLNANHDSSSLRSSAPGNKFKPQTVGAWTYVRYNTENILNLPRPPLETFCLLPPAHESYDGEVCIQSLADLDLHFGPNLPKAATESLLFLLRPPYDPAAALELSSGHSHEAPIELGTRELNYINLKLKLTPNDPTIGTSLGSLASSFANASSDEDNTEMYNRAPSLIHVTPAKPASKNEIFLTSNNSKLAKTNIKSCSRKSKFNSPLIDHVIKSPVSTPRKRLRNGDLIGIDSRLNLAVIPDLKILTADNLTSIVNIKRDLNESYCSIPPANKPGVSFENAFIPKYSCFSQNNISVELSTSALKARQAACPAEIAGQSAYEFEMRAPSLIMSNAKPKILKKALTPDYDSPLGLVDQTLTTRSDSMENIIDEIISLEDDVRKSQEINRLSDNHSLNFKSPTPMSMSQTLFLNRTLLPSNCRLAHCTNGPNQFLQDITGYTTLGGGMANYNLPGSSLGNKITPINCLDNFKRPQISFDHLRSPVPSTFNKHSYNVVTKNANNLHYSSPKKKMDSKNVSRHYLNSVLVNLMKNGEDVTTGYKCPVPLKREKPYGRMTSKNRSHYSALDANDFTYDWSSLLNLPVNNGIPKHSGLQFLTTHDSNERTCKWGNNLSNPERDMPFYGTDVFSSLLGSPLPPMTYHQNTLMETTVSPNSSVEGYNVHHQTIFPFENEDFMPNLTPKSPLADPFNRQHRDIFIGEDIYLGNPGEPNLLDDLI